MPALAILRTPVEVVFFTNPVPNAPKNCAPLNPESVVPCTMNLLAKATFAEPSTEFPASNRAVVHFPALVAVAALPPIFKAVAVPVRLVATPEAGVPKAGAVRVALGIVSPLGRVVLTVHVPEETCGTPVEDEVLIPVPPRVGETAEFRVILGAVPPLEAKGEEAVTAVTLPEAEPQSLAVNPTTPLTT